MEVKETMVSGVNRVKETRRVRLRLLLGVIFAFGLLWILGVAALAQGEVPEPYAGLKNPYPWTDNKTQAAGQLVYIRSCQACHGAQGGNVGMANFRATRVSNDLMARPDFYFWMVTEGNVDKGMPAYKSTLSEEQRWQALTYIWSLGIGPETPEPAPVTPTLEHGALPDCFRCHTRPLVKGHDALGSGSSACLTCHSDTNMGKLKLFSGAEVSQVDSPSVCGQCHSDKLIDWQKGDHGTLAKTQTVGGIPTNVRPKCADCHDPHQPQISLVTGTSLPSHSTATNGKLDCQSCHVRELTGHDKLGTVSTTNADGTPNTGSTACWACHLSTEMTTLHLAGQDTGFPLSNSTQLCAQCHQERYQDWNEGTHGVPAWKEGEPAIFGSEKVGCTNCHDPHRPQMPLLNITKPHPAPAESSPAAPVQLLAVVGLALLATTGIGIAVSRGGGGQ